MDYAFNEVRTIKPSEQNLLPSDELLPFTIEKHRPVWGGLEYSRLTGSSVDQVMPASLLSLTQRVSSYKEGPELFKIQSCNIPGGKVKLAE